MDVDNLAYAVGLPEDVRARVEVAGRVQLTPEETLSLTSSKFAHTCLVPLGIIVAVGLVGADAGGGDNSKVRCSWVRQSRPSFWPMRGKSLLLEWRRSVVKHDA